MQRPSSSGWIVMGTLVFGACAGDGGGGDAGVGAAVRDSAGVTIVENQVPAAGFGTFATLSDAPDLVLEAPGGFGEIAGIAVLQDGRVGVGDAGRIAFFAANGSPLASSDAGGGRSLGAVSRMGELGGDAIWVADHQTGRLFTVTPSSVEEVAAFPEGLFVAGRFDDDSYLLVPSWSLSLLTDPDAEGVRRDRASWARWSPSGLAAARVGEFPHDEIMVVRGPDGPMAGVPPFGRRTSRAVAGDVFYVGDQETFEIRRFDRDGALEGILRLDGLDLTLTEALKASVRPAPAPDGPSLVDRFWEGAPATRPAYTRLLVDDGQRLWVAEHVAGNAPPRTWMVFSPEGAALGLVTVPEGFTPVRIGPDWVWGVEGSASGQRAVRYGLRIGS